VLCRTAPCRGVVSARLQLQPCRPSPPSRPPDPKGSQKSRWRGSPTLQRVDQEPTEQQPHSRGRDGAQWARSPSCCLQGAPRSAPSLPPFSFSCRELSPGPVPPCLCLICLILGCLIGNQLNIKHILTAAGPPSAACRPRGLSAHHLFCDAQRWARSPAPPPCPRPPLPPAAHWPQPQFKGTGDLTGNRKPWERDGTDKALSCFREKSTSSPTRTHGCAARAGGRIRNQMEAAPLGLEGDAQRGSGDGAWGHRPVGVSCGVLP